MSQALNALLNGSGDAIYDVLTTAAGPAGALPLTREMLLERPSGDLFGLTQEAGMGWDPNQLLRDQVLILSTQGGIRGEDGKPIALGYHTGHWEVGLLMQAAAEELTGWKRLPFAGVCQRSLRRPFAGDDGDDGQPRLSQRCGGRPQAVDPLVADAEGGDRRRDVRQGSAGDDDGPRGVSTICRA